MNEKSERGFPRPLSGASVDPLPSGLAPGRQVLEGRHVRLEPMDPAAHTDDLYEASHTTEEGRAIWTYLPEGPWPNRASYANHIRANAGALDRLYYALRPLAGGRASGQASFMDIHAGNGVIEIGYIWFAPSMQRTRAAAEALYLMLDYAMTDLRYRRMQWRCNALNERSRGAARRLGFRFEGIFHNHMIYKGLNRDTAWYLILGEEWPAVRAILQDWLAADNFDAQGVATRSLTEMMGARTGRA